MALAKGKQKPKWAELLREATTEKTYGHYYDHWARFGYERDLDPRGHPLATVLFRLLNKVQWTRGSGGEIVGNDEYNRDSTHVGGGSNYVKDSWGPKSNPTAWRRTGYRDYREL